MADKGDSGIDRSKLRRASDLAPDIEIGKSFEDAKIEDQELVIVGWATDQRTGKKGDYTLMVFELEDGSKIHTSSQPVADKMESIIATQGDNPFPFIATFSRVRSQSNPAFRYWVMK